MEERPDRLDVLEVIPVRHVFQRENGRATYRRTYCQWHRTEFRTGAVDQADRAGLKEAQRLEDQRLTVQDRVGGGRIELTGMLRRCFVSLVHRRSGHNLVSRYSTHLDIQNMSREIIKPPIELLPAHRTISPTSHLSGS